MFNFWICIDVVGGWIVKMFLESIDHLFLRIFAMLAWPVEIPGYYYCAALQFRSGVG